MIEQVSIYTSEIVNCYGVWHVSFYYHIAVFYSFLWHKRLRLQPVLFARLTDNQ